MQTKKFIYFSSFILLALMLFKVSALHVYSHQDSSLDQIENCNICDSAIENQTAEHLNAPTAVYKVPELIATYTQEIVYKSQSNTVSTEYLRLFGRPPPALG